LINIIDYGTSNVYAVYKRVQRTGAHAIVSNRAEDIRNAEKIILPGVGHFGRAMQNLKRLCLLEALNDAVVNQKKPVLGICLGMQLMAEGSEEGDAEGLGWIGGKVKKLAVSDVCRFKIPHMGWNSAELMKDSPLTKRLKQEDSFYFTHSYHYEVRNQSEVLQMTEYSNKFVSAISRENIYGVQYHPEKSYDAGTVLLENFAKL
jgi:imidazole glycerol-phosphate synthase subunit HisH